MEHVCQICGKSCGEYTLCSDCFNDMQEGRIAKCKNCGSWYKVGEVCSCLKASSKEIYDDEYEDERIYAAANKQFNQNKQKKGCFGKSFVLLLPIIAIIVLFVVQPWESGKGGNGVNNETDIVTQITKTPPDISFREAQDLSEFKTISILIDANDNYKEVVVELVVYDKNNTVIVQKNLIQTNLYKGKTYELSYTLTWSEAMKADTYSCRILSYK